MDYHFKGKPVQIYIYCYTCPLEGKEKSSLTITKSTSIIFLSETIQSSIISAFHHAKNLLVSEGQELILIP
jgi:hypothetical protein